MDAQNNWKLDLDFLKENISRQTKPIVVNFPNTPTGYTMPKEMFNQLIEITAANMINLAIYRTLLPVVLIYVRTVLMRKQILGQIYHYRF